MGGNKDTELTAAPDPLLGPMVESKTPRWHVSQRAQGRVSATQTMGDTPANDSPALERAADAMGARAVQANNPRAADHGYKLALLRRLSRSESPKL